MGQYIKIKETLDRTTDYQKKKEKKEIALSCSPNSDLHYHSRLVVAPR